MPQTPPTPKQLRMIGYLEELLALADPAVYMPSAQHHDTRYDLERLRVFGAEYLAKVVRGEIGVSCVTRLAKELGVTPAMLTTLLQQPDYALGDGTHRLNFVAETVLRVQARELADQAASGLVWVRTQPTCPLDGIHASYKGKFAYGLQQDARAGAFDSIFATYATPAGADSINFGGLIHALDKDVTTGAIAQMHLSPLHRLSLERPTAAMFAHAGAVLYAVNLELPERPAEAALLIFLQGRFEGPEEETVFLARPTRTVCLVDEPGYQLAARRALGDEPDLIVQAEGPTPDDRGLEKTHHYVRSDGTTVDNDAVRSAIAGGRVEYFKLDDNDLIADSPADEELFVVLLPGELRARRPDGGCDAGQALLVVHQDGYARWFSILNKADGSRAWTGDEDHMRARLQKVTDAFALIEGPNSTAGRARRQQYENLRSYDVPMSHPSGRENNWRISALVGQAGRPDPSPAPAKR